MSSMTCQDCRRCQPVARSVVVEGVGHLQHLPLIKTSIATVRDGDYFRCDAHDELVPGNHSCSYFARRPSFWRRLLIKLGIGRAAASVVVTADHRLYEQLRLSREEQVAARALQRVRDARAVPELGVCSFCKREHDRCSTCRVRFASCVKCPACGMGCAVEETFGVGSDVDPVRVQYRCSTCGLSGVGSPELLGFRWVGGKCDGCRAAVVESKSTTVEGGG